MNTFFEIFGWYGTVAIISAYFLNSFDLIESNSIAYQFLNITGAMGIGLISYRKKVYQSVVVQIIWISIGLLALIKIAL